MTIIKFYLITESCKRENGMQRNLVRKHQNILQSKCVYRFKNVSKMLQNVKYRALFPAKIIIKLIRIKRQNEVQNNINNFKQQI